MDVLALEAGGIAATGEEGLDGGADLFLVVVHLRRVNAVRMSAPMVSSLWGEDAVRSIARLDRC